MADAWRRGLFFAVVAGSVLAGLGLLLDPSQGASAILLASQYVLGVALGGLTFVAFTYVVGAGWSTAFRRIPEALARTLPFGAATVLVALAFAPLLYEWTHADVVANDPVLQAKSGWLDLGFFLGRAVAYLVIWWAFSRAILRVSVRQDTEGRQDTPGGSGLTRRNTVLSAVFLVVFAVTFSLATFDWIMSLSPHWFSTVFAVYNFAGAFTSALSAIVILVILLRRWGPLEGVLRPEHLHDLGKLLFGFATFWAYIWFCQFMLIWYANIPEETLWFAVRQAGWWQVLFVVNPIVNWLIPFLVLLPRPAKRSESIMLRVAALLLLGRWLDLFLQVAPAHPLDGVGSVLGHLGVPLLIGALFVIVLVRALSRADLVPRGDPTLVESLSYHP